MKSIEEYTTLIDEVNHLNSHLSQAIDDIRRGQEITAQTHFDLADQIYQRIKHNINELGVKK